MLLSFRYFSFRIKARVKRNLPPPSPFFLPQWLCWDISPHLLWPLNWNLHHQFPRLLGLWIQTQFPFPRPPVCRWQIMGLFSLHNLVSWFLILTFSSLCLSLWKPPFYSLLLRVWRYPSRLVIAFLYLRQIIKSPPFHLHQGQGLRV